MKQRKHSFLALLILLLTVAGPASAAPRVLPREQATHFCRLLFSDDGKIYPLSIYAQHLTAMLCGDLHYGEYTPEQVFTGLIFFYEDWSKEPMPFSNGQGRVVIEELHSGQTLRLFPHFEGSQIRWYAPTDVLPQNLDAEHRKYIQEVFFRLDAEVQAGRWAAVDDCIDKMIAYQCRFGGTEQAADTHLWLAVLPLLLLFGFWLGGKRLFAYFSPAKNSAR